MFIILSNALESYVLSLHIPNLVLNYFHLGLLIMCFSLSLGNQPQGSKWRCTLTFIGFGIVTIYMTVGHDFCRCVVIADIWYEPVA